MTINHLNDLRDLLPVLIKRQNKHVFHLILALTALSIGSHGTVQPSPSLFVRSKVIMDCYLRTIGSNRVSGVSLGDLLIESPYLAVRQQRVNSAEPLSETIVVPLGDL